MALIYQCLSLTITGKRGGPSASSPSASAASAAPPPVEPLRMGVPHPHPRRYLLPEQNLLTVGGHGTPPSLAHQQCLEDRRRREVSSDFHDEAAARPRPCRTVLQRVLRRIHARIAVKSPCSRLLPDSVKEFTKTPVSGEHLRHPVGQGRPAPVQPNVPVWEDGLEDPGTSAPMSRLARHLSSETRRARTLTSASTGPIPSDRFRVWR